MSVLTENFPEKLYLSGADCFFLAMENHYEKYGKTGNTCHLLFSIKGQLSKAELRKKTEDVAFFSWLRKIELRRPFFQLPYWHYQSNTNTQIEINELESDEENLPKEVLAKGIFLKQTPLFRFSIIKRSTGQVDIVFSWHHILMDAQGAETLMRVLGGDIAESNVHFFPAKAKKISIFKALYILHFSKEFVKKSSKKPLVQFPTKENEVNPESMFKVIELDLEQTKILDQKAITNGAKISKGSFYLAATTKAINEWLVSKGNTKGTFWVPVPQNKKPKGKFGPVISNLQSFMFYRIPRTELKDLAKATAYLTSEMIDLIRHKRPENYAIMSDVLRYLPSPFYYFLIKGPGGGSIASFLYSDPGVNEFKSFMGTPIEGVTNFPPGTFPPGLMVIFERFNGKQKIIINYTKPRISEEDLLSIEENIRKELLAS